MSAPTMPITSNRRELSRLLSAAVVNKKFCRLLLTDPEIALASGYNGESFRLAKEEHELIMSIRAQNLADFARQLTHNHSGVNRTRTKHAAMAYNI
jgi:hypothetical protein